MEIFGFSQPKPDGCEELSGFEFTYKWTDQDDVEHKDTGHVRYVLDWGNGFYEFYMDARSGVGFTVGPKVGGSFCCITSFEKGSELADFSDVFWNKERLSGPLPSADAAAIAYALYTFSKIQKQTAGE